MAGGSIVRDWRHNMKFGLMGGYLRLDQRNFTNDHNLQFRVSNGVPNLIMETVLPFDIKRRVRYDALYAQEQWTRGRMTLQAALRFDHARRYFPAQTIGPSNYLPLALTFPDTKGVDSCNDINPRMGVAYDLFGNGKTSLKVISASTWSRPATTTGATRSPIRTRALPRLSPGPGPMRTVTSSPIAIS